MVERQSTQISNITPTQRPDGEGCAKAAHVHRQLAKQIALLDLSSQEKDDIKNTPEDILMWNRMSERRRRRHTFEGLRPLWTAFTTRAVNLIPESESSLKLWQNFMKLAFSDEAVLFEIHAHLTRQESSGTPAPWSRFYCDLVGRFILSDLDKVKLWHARLSMHKISIEDWLPLFLKVLEHPVALKRLRNLYMEVHIEGTNLYKQVLGTFERTGKLETGLSWHVALIAREDFPDNVADVLPLLNHFSGNDVVVRTIMDGLEKVKTPPANEVGHSRSDLALAAAGKKLNLQTKELPVLSDEFCSRLFATRAFPVKAVINMLALVCVQEIGGSSLREIGLRTVKGNECSSQHLKEYLYQLGQADIRVQNSTFSRAVNYLVETNDGLGLFSLLSSDMHSDAFDDSFLQKDLLASYLAAHDHIQASRTLAVLSVNADDDFARETLKQNLLLRASADCHDLSRLGDIAATMQRHSLPLSAETCRHLLDRVLHGQREAPPAVELLALANLWQICLPVTPDMSSASWIEIMHALKNAHLFDHYESLAVWLTRWYLRPSKEHCSGWQPAFSSSKPAASTLASETRHELIKTLFPESTLAGIVSYTLTHYTSGKPDGTNGVQPLEKRADALSKHASMRGIRLVAKLRSLGLYVPHEGMRRVCAHHLRRTYGLHLTKTDPETREIVLPPLFKEHVMAMRSAFGGDLFWQGKADTHSWYVRFFKSLRVTLPIEAKKFQRSFRFTKMYEGPRVKLLRKAKRT